ncbi:hypothetical protein TEGAF0_00020 [Sediminibacterium sp. TEGAF015]|nr:hypothetical protein TEGAF0_00020 [Sediminibacterium sp. TEGAF015]
MLLLNIYIAQLNKYLINLLISIWSKVISYDIRL